MSHSIYLIKNKINGKIYVGLTGGSIEDRFKGHVKASKVKSKKHGRFQPIGAAIRKYGAENFSIELLETDLTFEEACDREIFYIKKLDSKNPDRGYNATLGGNCGALPIRLTKETIIGVISDYCDGYSFNSISGKYNLSKSSVFDITRLRFSKSHNIDQDIINKLLFIKSKSNKRHRINDDDILNIFRDYATGLFTVAKLANKYGITVGTMHPILTRKTFKNVLVPQDLFETVSNILKLYHIKKKK